MTNELAIIGQVKADFFEKVNLKQPLCNILTIVMSLLGPSVKNNGRTPYQNRSVKLSIECLET
jgi:hypothetical protein